MIPPEMQQQMQVEGFMQGGPVVEGGEELVESQAASGTAIEGEVLGEYEENMEVVGDSSQSRVILIGTTTSSQNTDSTSP